MNENNSEEKKEKTPSEQKEEKSRDDFSEENNHKVIDTFPPPPLEKPKDKDDKKQVDCIANERHNLLFSVRRSVRYHNRRILFYDHLHKLAISLALLSSSATVVAVLSRLNVTSLL